MPYQPSQSATAKPAAFRQRLAPVTAALISAQFLYAALALWLQEHGYKAMAHGLTERTFIIAALTVGVLAAIISFPVAAARIRQQPAQADSASVLKLVQKQFFIGFALSEVASLAGLFVFFLFADLKPLLVLVFVASAAILGHYSRARKTLDDFERTPR
jgi:hypothetical protein